MYQAYATFDVFSIFFVFGLGGWEQFKNLTIEISIEPKPFHLPGFFKICRLKKKTLFPQKTNGIVME